VYTSFMKNLRYFLLAMSVIVLITVDLHAQTPRLVGGRRFVLDNNDLITTNNDYLVDNLGSLGINNAGNITGTFPNTSALLTLLAGAKTVNLFIDGGSTWGINVVNTNNSIQTSGRSIFGDDAGIDDATFKMGTGLFQVTGIVPSTSSNGTTNVRMNTLAGPP
ncbi:MAG: hypothetical protein ACHQM6_00385, partial [Candidatus Kapaibacterium sp.]